MISDIMIRVANRFRSNETIKDNKLRILTYRVPIASITVVFKRVYHLPRTRSPVRARIGGGGHTQ